MQQDTLIHTANMGGDGVLDQLLNYGGLGILLIMVILALRYIIKEYKSQTIELLDSYKDINDSFKSELNDLKKEKSELNESFIDHLKTTESNLLGIIGENTKAFTTFSESNQSISLAVKQLTASIENRDRSNKELNTSIEKIANKLNKI